MNRSVAASSSEMVWAGLSVARLVVSNCANFPVM